MPLCNSTMVIAGHSTSLSGAEVKTGFEFQIVTDKGTVTVLPAEVIVLAKDYAA